MAAYYNEFEPYAAAWLRNLIKQGLIADGEVDERSIVDVRPDDLRGFTQVHCFAGIGVWSYALRLAGWPDDRPVWTGSCPCQPFSAAGKGKGIEDERHLWPEFHRLIAECRPAVVFGEQVASKDGLNWLDAVCADMEASGYAIGAADMCAAGIGAPHIRQRLWFVAESMADTSGGRQPRQGWGGSAQGQRVAERGLQGGLGGLADAERDDGRGEHRQRLGEPTRASESQLGERERLWSDLADGGAVGGPRPTNGHWRAADWLHCRDGKWRPVEPGTFPLAHGAPSRVGRLRAYGNAIVGQAAAEIIGAYMETRTP